MKGIMKYYDENKKEIGKVSLLKLPLREEYIISESIRLYKEEEPCIIYRTTIINRTGINLLAELKDGDKNLYYNLEELRVLIGDIFEAPDRVDFVRFL